jgi:hypothetical protein
LDVREFLFSFFSFENEKVFDFDTTIHFAEFSSQSMTITGANYNRTLITLATKSEIKILKFSEEVENLNLKFGDKTSANTFYSSENEITSAHLLAEHVRRLNQTRSNCTSIYGNTLSQVRRRNTDSLEYIFDYWDHELK